MDEVSHKIKDEADSRQVPVGMSVYSQNLKSDRAADIALKRISVDLVNQLDLFDTTLHLYAMDGLTPSEMEKLNNIYITELEKKQYLVTTVIPSKGHYRGMILLRRALKESKQNEILYLLEKTYDEEVDAINNPAFSENYAMSASFSENYAMSACSIDVEDVGNLQLHLVNDDSDISCHSESDFIFDLPELQIKLKDEDEVHRRQCCRLS